MARIPTPIPKTLADIVRRAFTGSAIDTVWKVLVSVLFLFIGLGLVAAGPVGYLIGAILLGSLFTEPATDAVSDIWNRNFWVFRP